MWEPRTQERQYVPRQLFKHLPPPPDPVGVGWVSVKELDNVTFAIGENLELALYALKNAHKGHPRQKVLDLSIAIGIAGRFWRYWRCEDLVALRKGVNLGRWYHEALERQGKIYWAETTV
jgi:hypothetical protein